MKQKDFAQLPPFRVALCIESSGASLIFNWKGIDAAIHFKDASIACRVAETLNIHIHDCIEAALAEKQA